MLELGMDYQTAMNKIERYIDYRDRSEFEVIQKLKTLDVPVNLHQKIMDELKLLDLIDDERFSKVFTQGKFRIKNWGRIKIRYALRQKFVKDSFIDKATQFISDEEYKEKLQYVYDLKRRDFGKKLKMEEKAKIARHLQGKGFELEFIMPLMQKDK